MQKTERNYILAGLGLVFLYLLPSIITGENHYVLVHDFLDSTVAHIKSMKDHGALFDFSQTMPILSGIPRSVYGSAVDLKIWLFALLPPYWAILANIFLIKATAFLGLFALLSGHILPEGEGRLRICFIASAIFALVPFYPDYGVSSAGVPMVTLAFLNLWKGRKQLVSILLLVYYAIFSWLVLGGVFVCVTAALAILVYMIREKKFPLMPFIGLLILTLTYIGTNIEMFITYFTPGEPISREEYAIVQFSFKSLLEALSVLFVSQYHAGTCFAALIIVAFVIVWKKYRSEDKVLDNLFVMLCVISGLVILSALIKQTLSGAITFLREFQIDRFFFLFPGMCFILFGATLYELAKHGKTKAAVWIAATVFIVNLAFDPHIRNNAGKTLGLADYPGFGQFYDTELFDEIKDDLGITENGYKVACLGMYQAVAEYNGIYTVDGYIQMYPLRYKHQFQKVIQGEIDKSETIREYFCDWGSRCYLFSSELGLKYMFSKKKDRKVEHLDIDCDALGGLGCRYILSAVEICNFRELGLELAGQYSHPDSYWNIRAYRIPTQD